MHKKFNLFRDERGMRVVEVVAALAIVSLVLVSLGEGYNLAELSRRQSALQQNVAAVAEELLAQDGESVLDGAEQIVETASGKLQCTWQSAPAPTAGLEEVTLVITDEATGKQWVFMTVRR